MQQKLRYSGPFELKPRVRKLACKDEINCRNKHSWFYFDSTAEWITTVGVYTILEGNGWKRHLPMIFHSQGWYKNIELSAVFLENIIQFWKIYQHLTPHKISDQSNNKFRRCQHMFKGTVILLFDIYRLFKVIIGKRLHALE